MSNMKSFLHFQISFTSQNLSYLNQLLKFIEGNKTLQFFSALMSMTHTFGNLNIKLSNLDKIKCKIRQIK